MSGFSVAIAEHTERVLSLESITWCGPQLYIDITLDGIKFPTTFWYEFNLEELHTHYGDEAMERVYFYLAALSLLKLTSLKPTVIHISAKLAQHYTIQFQEFWEKFLEGQLGQWRYENGMANWKGPRFACSISTVAAPVPAKIKSPQVFDGDKAVKTISCCGGGKDGFLSTKLLEDANIPFSSFSYAVSRCGTPRNQHARAQKVLQYCKPTQSHWVMVTDAYFDVPLLNTNDQWLKKCGVKSRCDCALVESLSFLPVMMHYGYQYVVLSNEYSANTGNLHWAAEDGKPVNHQWEKCYEAEQLISSYIKKVLVNVHYYSILQPIHDMLIFTLLRQHLDGIPYVFSCNVSPPWCKRCPKCCYVWLCLQAYMPQDIINPMFDNKNLLDMQENQFHFTQMLGLGDQKPFECIGEFKEVQLAFEMCRRKGICGRAMEIFEREFGTALDVAPILKTYTVVHKEQSIPDFVAQPVLAKMEKAAASIKAELQI